MTMTQRMASTGRSPVGSTGSVGRQEVPPPVTPAAAESPSVFATGTDGPPAYEMKFLLTEELAHAVEARLGRRLVLDPHADPALGGAYLTTSVYTDTPGFEALAGAGALGRRKYRVRRYGAGEPVV